jgi:hypothetical protein
MPEQDVGSSVIASSSAEMDSYGRSKRWWYCPRGCNAFETFDTDPECAACGCAMSEDDSAYDGVLERLEEEGIRQVGRRMIMNASLSELQEMMVNLEDIVEGLKERIGSLTEGLEDANRSIRALQEGRRE